MSKINMETEIMLTTPILEGASYIPFHTATFQSLWRLQLK